MLLLPNRLVFMAGPFGLQFRQEMEARIFILFVGVVIGVCWGGLENYTAHSGYNVRCGPHPGIADNITVIRFEVDHPLQKNALSNSSRSVHSMLSCNSSHATLSRHSRKLFTCCFRIVLTLATPLKHVPPSSPTRMQTLGECLEPWIFGLAVMSCRVAFTDLGLSAVISKRRKALGTARINSVSGQLGPSPHKSQVADCRIRERSSVG